MSARMPICREPLPRLSCPTTPVPPMPSSTVAHAGKAFRHDVAGSMLGKTQFGMLMQISSKIDEVLHIGAQDFRNASIYRSPWLKVVLRSGR